MHEVNEVLRVAAPAPRPQAIAFDGTRLWLGSLETERLYALDPHAWVVREEIAVPGKPWGMTSVGAELRVILGETDDDHRTIYRVAPGKGLHRRGSIACPDDTGSQLAYDGEQLFVSQWYNKRLIALDAAGAPVRVIDAPHEICGQTIVGGRFYLLTTDDEHSHRYFLTRLDARVTPVATEDLAELHFDARGLAYDGERFWTNHREANETVAFNVDL